MTDKSKWLLCYNRGCGQQYDPNYNGPDSCRHHVGVPVFHDAYKGWSCCKKKCTDFTEFLNIKGCTVSCHTNVKPPEPEKPKEDKSLASEVIEYRSPEPKNTTIQRPPFDTPLVLMKPQVSQSLKDQLASLNCSKTTADNGYDDAGAIPIGTPCKNNSCKQTYEGSETLNTKCTYHPGYAVFHEGLKFWSCCTKRTTDFNTFLEQVGCTIGEHLWFKKTGGEEVKCRLDWHQTATHVYVSIFGKKCDPEKSTVELSPVRLKFNLFFPEQGGSFSKDIELKGVVDVEKSVVTMVPTKVEVKLHKLNLGSWSKLEIPRAIEQPAPSIQEEKNVTELVSEVDAVDLSCI